MARRRLSARAPPTRSPAEMTAPSLGGYGLQIVDRMADAWGTAGPHGEQIWFELRR